MCRINARHSALLIGWILSIWICTTESTGQSKPFTLGQVLRAIASTTQVSETEGKTLMAKITNDIRRRKVDFLLTKENESILRAEGASDQLIEVIRQNSPPLPVQKPVVIPTPTPTAIPTPTPAATPIPSPRLIPTPTPSPIQDIMLPPLPVSLPELPAATTKMEFELLMARANSNFEKGAFDAALVDYDQALEMMPENAAAYLSRGNTHAKMGALEKAKIDFDKAIEIDPKEPSVYIHRGSLFERMQKPELAIADYRMAIDLDPKNDPAKARLRTLQNELTRQSMPASVPGPASTTNWNSGQEPVDLGEISEDQFVVRSMPIISSAAKNIGLFGAVTVRVQIDEKGTVVSAKAISGHFGLRRSAEEAAIRSKLKPVMSGSTAVNATGLITYIIGR